MKYSRICSPDSRGYGELHSVDEPMKAITTIGIGGAGAGGGDWYWIDDGERAMKKIEKDKPAYRVPSIDEIRTIPWNGFKVVSTFSGCGGSCLGYRMAGFRVVWANEFVPTAADSYEANSPDSILDRRDVRKVQSEEILKATGLQKGELDLFDGSPPCQAFSTAGKRHKGWGQEKKYEGGHQQRNEDLFFEYVRLLNGLMPRCFVAENVSGLIKGVAKGYFLEILAALKDCGYRVDCRVLDAQWLGVPQQRQRCIFVGVREDLNTEPCHPNPLPWRYSVVEAIPWLSGGRVRQAEGFNSEVWVDTASEPYTTVGTSPASGCNRNSNGGKVEVDQERRKFTITELRRICAFPDDFILTGSYSKQWMQLGNSVPPLMMKAIAETVRDRILIPAKGNEKGRRLVRPIKGEDSLFT